jgi:murein DD-endopeptidase MepM/ murein hydrolase activator NlpD
LSLRKRHYIVFISRDPDGTLHKVPVSMHYAYIFLAAAIVGIFTMTGLAGSYSRMLIKTAHFNQLRQERDSSRQHSAQLEQALAEKNVQVASLGSIASEISALYGLTTSKLALPLHVRVRASKSSESAATAPLLDTSSDDYYKSLDTFYALRTTADTASATLHPLPTTVSSLSTFDALLPSDSTPSGVTVPSLWPVMGRITSGFGEREDPVLGNGEGEFHRGLDISAPNGTPVRATADGVVISATNENGYGREVTIDHGHGFKTLYGHLSGFNCLTGQQVLRGQIIAYVGHSGRVTGANLHYEVRIHDTPVNPHKFLQTTLAQMDGISAGL